MKGKLTLWFFVLLGIGLSVYGIILELSSEESSKESLSKENIVLPSPTRELQSVQDNVLGEANTDKVEKGIRVIEVFDGDTVKLDTGEVIRLLGINAPETGQPYSSQSTQFLKETLLNRPVRIEYDIQTKDRYNRTLAYLYSGSLFVNAELVKRGLAVIETIEPNVLYVDTFKMALDEAKKNCSGIWEGVCRTDLSSKQNSGCVQIASVNANPPGDDNLNKNEEWIEIRNSCSTPEDLTKWLIKDNSTSNSYQFKTYALKSGSTVRVHSGCGADSSTDLYWKCPEGKYAVWNNAGDHAYLYNNEGVLVSDYSY